jgi:hypothetical protein
MKAYGFLFLFEGTQDQHEDKKMGIHRKEPREFSLTRGELEKEKWEGENQIWENQIFAEKLVPKSSINPSHFDGIE